MKKAIILLLLFGVNYASYSQNKAEKIFKNHIRVIENLTDEKVIYDLDSTISFLENLTGIKSEIYPGFTITYAPSEQNLKDWKSWFEKNKKRLYWDAKSEKVKLKVGNKHNR